MVAGGAMRLIWDLRKLQHDVRPTASSGYATKKPMASRLSWPLQHHRRSVARTVNREIGIPIVKQRQPRAAKSRCTTIEINT